MATGRALSDGEKQAVVERILAAWVKVPALRLGQFIDNAVMSAGKNGGVFYVEDTALAEACERFAAKGGA